MEPGDNPAYKTVAFIPPIETVTEFVVGVVVVASCPSGTIGVVGPKPVPYSVTISPAIAARAPGITLGSAISVADPATWAAMLIVEEKTKKAGATGCTVSIATSLDSWFGLSGFTSTTRFRGPG